MNFFDVAKNMEVKSKALYEELARESGKDLSGIFTFLAREEQQHYDIFDVMQQRSDLTVPADDNILKRAHDHFAHAARDFAIPEAINDAEVVYKKALGLEEDAVSFYTAEQAKIENESYRETLDLIIEQEKRHVTLINNLVEFVQHPKIWLENAEFNHLKEY